VWTLRICPKGCEQFNTYVGDYLSIEWLFGQFKKSHPDAHYQLENTLTGATTGPHDGTWFPEWFNRDGLILEPNWIDEIFTEAYCETQRKAKEQAMLKADEIVRELREIQEDDIPI